MYDLLPGIASSTKFSAVGMSKNFGGIYAPTNVCVMGVYGTSKLPKFYRNDFRHDLYCYTWCWFEMST